jgi:hypothetical protein
MRYLFVLVTFAAAALCADKYDGPRPPKPDLLYLVHADNLVPTESADAKEESKKDEAVYAVPGANSPARTPVAEPIFLIQSEKVIPGQLQLYKMEVKGGRREVTVSKGKRRGNARPLYLSVTKLDGNLYKVEAAQPLDDGQYTISPNGSNQVFCFEVY